jgi:seryl-tRNA(Sec) selenium transferase
MLPCIIENLGTKSIVGFSTLTRHLIEQRSVTARATNGRHAVVLNETIHAKAKAICHSLAMEQLRRRAGAMIARLRKKNRDGSDSRAVHLAERFRGGAHDGRTSAQPGAGAARQIAA